MFLWKKEYKNEIWTCEKIDVRKKYSLNEHLFIKLLQKVEHLFKKTLAVGNAWSCLLAGVNEYAIA